ncbi:MAG: TonB-dependent copper receptor [Nitrosomonadales bacterium]|nr:TonB-dependent copper receptor [Nitrosomonadales bacterium]
MQLNKALLAVLALSFQAHAADVQTLGEVVVTAPQSDEPLTVRTNPKAPRQPVPAHDGADYLKTIPGFSVIRKGGTDGDPVLRGMAGSRLNILLDGQVILGGCGGRMDPPTAYVFPAAYDRITVLKGPQTVLYGPGNSAGVVLFERDVKRAEQAGVKANGSLMLGSFGRNDAMAEVRAGSQNAYVQANGTRSHAGDYKDGSGNAVHSAYTRWSGNAAAGWTPDDNTRFELSLAKSDGEAAYADRAVDGSKFERDNYGVKFEKKHLSPMMDSIEAQAYYNYVDHVMDSYSLRAGGNPASMMAAMNPDRKTTGGRAVVGLALGDATRAKIGVDLQHNIHTGRYGAAPGYMGDYTLMPRVQDAVFRNTGVFGEVSHIASERGRVIGGLRLDGWRAEDSRATITRGMATLANPTANLSRNETLTSGFARYEHDLASSTAYIGLGRTERAPDYWELISKESAATASAFDTKPEETTQLDVGLNYAGEGLSGSVSAFYSKVTDFILIQSGVMKGMSSVSIARNIKATTWGAEAGLIYPLAGSWKLNGSLAYVHGNNDTDGVALGQMPPLEARIGTSYDDKVWSFGALLRMVSEQSRFTVNQGNIVGQDIGRTGGFGVFSLNGGWRPRKGAQLTAGVDNLFNRVYAEHISRAGSMVAGFTQTTRVNEVGRNLWIKGNIEF